MKTKKQTNKKKEFIGFVKTPLFKVRLNENFTKEYFEAKKYKDGKVSYHQLIFICNGNKVAIVPFINFLSHEFKGIDNIPDEYFEKFGLIDYYFLNPKGQKFEVNPVKKKPKSKKK